MGLHEDAGDAACVQRLETNLSEVILLVRDLAKRVAYLETQVGSADSARTSEWREDVKRSLIRLMAGHDWEAYKSDDYRRKRFAELGYENILQLAYMLPLETLLEVWQQYAPFKVPDVIDPEYRPHAAVKERTLLKHLNAEIKEMDKDE